MTDENEKQEQPIEEPEDLKFVRELFEKLEKKSLPELLAGLEKQFYVNACGAIELFEKICLNAPNNKKKVEAAKFILGLLRDPSFVKNMAVIHELRGRMGKGAAATDDKVTWGNKAKKG